MRRRRFIIGAVAVLSPASAGEPPESETHAPADDITRALSGDRFRYGGEELHLVDIIAPSLYRLGDNDIAYFNEARSALQQLLDKGSPKLEEVESPTRWRARVVIARAEAGGPSLQEQMVRQGAARVSPQSEKTDFIEALFKAEREARADARGLWMHSAYKIFDAQACEGAIGDYHLVEGVVRSANDTRGRFYLNFGDDYREDFTASASSRARKKWAGDGFDLAALEGTAVRIRGFVSNINGPSIELTHRQQIEILKRV